MTRRALDSHLLASPRVTARLATAPLAASLFAAILWSFGPAAAQTPEEPLVSNVQFLAAASGPSDFPLDDGVTRVWLDVRQGAPEDAVSLGAPGGEALQQLVPVETVAADLDMSGVDFLELWMDASTWVPPSAGTYTIDSPAPYLATVQVEGGGRMLFWIEGLAAERTLPVGKPVNLYVALNGAGREPLDGGSVTVTIEQMPFADRKPPSTPWTVTVALPETAEPGIYAVTLGDGVPEAGVYTLSVEGERGLLRRHLVTSLAAGVPGKQPAGIDLEPPTSHLLVEIEEVDPGGSPPSGSASPGTILYFPEGAANPAKPVVVLLHGFNSQPGIWMGNQGFAGAAVEANYRVAAVALHGDESFFTNAAILADALPAIAAHYDVRKVVVVAHSKGGVDIDAAALLHGMTDRVRSVITLASPHWGSPLADLADSTWFWWLAEILGRRNEAQRSMKLGAMAAYRAQVASHPRNTFEWLDFRTISGWKYWDELVAYYILSGPYLANHGGGSGNGGNDGVVNYRDAKRPVGTEIFGGRPDGRTAVNHRQIHRRSKYWAHVQAQLLTVSYDNSPSTPGNPAATFEDDGSSCAIRLTWEDRSRFETGFRVERSVDGGPFAELPVSLDAGAEELWDHGTSEGHTYAYRLRAHVDHTWFSDYSGTATATFPAVCSTSPPDVRVTRPGGGNLPRGGTYDLGSTPQGQVLERTLTLHNDGGLDLHVGGVSVTGSGFAVTQLSTTTIEAGQTATFKVRALATNPGTPSATVSIVSDDPDESPYTFTVKSTVVSPAPEIRVTRAGGGEVPDGGAYAFGPVPLANLPVSREFRIHNDGTADLTIGNPGSLLTGIGFSQIGNLPAGVVPPGGSTTFRVRFHVGQAGAFDGAVEILNNDPDEGQYDIALSGAALAPCVPTATRVCLRGDRFAIDLAYSGGAAAARAYTPLSGFFTFANPDNLEVGVKILGPAGGSWWVFHGPATSHAYTLTVFDTQTGAVRTYIKPAGSQCGHADTTAFPGLWTPEEPEDRLSGLSLGFESGDFEEGAIDRGALEHGLAPFPAAGSLPPRGSCVPGPTSVCLNGGRFRVEVVKGGTPQPADGLTPLSGVFSFANPDNVEVVVKVLGPATGQYWVFYSSLSHQSYEVRVTDTATGTVRTYANPAGTYCGVADTDAF
jgi:pimeloyl-ACP methyl ester carboxylesterase